MKKPAPFAMMRAFQCKRARFIGRINRL